MGANILNIAPVQGHIDSSFDDPRWLENGEGSNARLVLWALGDDLEGAVALCITSPPNPDGVETPAHSHGGDQLRLIVEGSFKVGTKWYHAGEMRFQEANRIYGPEVVGPEGCKQIVVFKDRHALTVKLAKTPPEPVQMDPRAKVFFDKVEDMVRRKVGATE